MTGQLQRGVQLLPITLVELSKQWVWLRVGTIFPVVSLARKVGHSPGSQLTQPG
jgi:hypothetical protein